MATALVLDSPESSGTLPTLLDQHPGWTSKRVTDTAAALDLLKDEKFEVLLANSDSVRGASDWVSLVRENYPNLPVILVASENPNGTIVKALMLGAATFVPEGADSEQLISTIERILALCSQGRAPRLDECLAEASHCYSLPNDRTILPVVLCHVQTQLDRFEVCPRADCLRIAVALEEALTNAIVHGNLEVPSKLREREGNFYEKAIVERSTQEPYKNRRTAFTAKFRMGEAVFVVADEGPGFDPNTIPDPTNLENLLKPHGRGLLLMRTFMDEVRYNERGNEVTMVKHSCSLR